MQTCSLGAVTLILGDSEEKSFFHGKLMLWCYAKRIKPTRKARMILSSL